MPYLWQRTKDLLIYCTSRKDMQFPTVPLFRVSEGQVWLNPHDSFSTRGGDSVPQYDDNYPQLTTTTAQLVISPWTRGFHGGFRPRHETTKLPDSYEGRIQTFRIDK